MAKDEDSFFQVNIIIKDSLRNEIGRRFKKESAKVVRLIESLRDNPNKGKLLANIGGILLNELRYGTYRIYFIVDGHRLYLFNAKEITDLLIEFLDISKKNDQERTISVIKDMLSELSRS